MKMILFDPFVNLSFKGLPYAKDDFINNLQVVNVPSGAPEDRLQRYYSLLGCDLIDIVVVQIGGKSFDCICDDEGLFKDNRVAICWQSQEPDPHIVGKVLLCHNDGKGDETSIEEDDFNLILDSLAVVSARDGFHYPVIVEDEEKPFGYGGYFGA